MKKKTLSILSLCIALFAALALVGCGGSASSGGGGSSASKSEGKEKAPVAKKTDFIWFKVEMPEGVGVSDSAGKNADRVQLTFPEEREQPQSTVSSPFGKRSTDGRRVLCRAGRKAHRDTFQWEDGDPVEYNGRTWLTGTCKDNGGILYPTSLPTSSTGSVYILISERRPSQERSRGAPQLHRVPRRHQGGRHRGPRRRDFEHRDQVARVRARTARTPPLNERAPHLGESRQHRPSPLLRAHIAT